MKKTEKKDFTKNDLKPLTDFVLENLTINK